VSIGEQFAHILAALPALLWAAIAGYVVWLLRGPIEGAIGRITSVEAFSVKLAMLSTQAMTAAIDMARKHARWKIEVPPGDAAAALARAGRERERLQGAEILWVDDCPSNNRNEMRMLTGLGASITVAATSDEAVAAQRMATEQSQPFHLVLSDISRELPTHEPTAGIAMLARLRQEGFGQPVIFYIGQRDRDRAAPAGAFGVTDRPDELLHMILDALARARTA
jgi:CheY-like chemotaxis protein